ncbi:tyrosine-type recombinase/integrase [Shewanella gaetbuli]
MNKDRTFTEIREKVASAWCNILIGHKRKILRDGLYSQEAIASLASAGIDTASLGLNASEQVKAEPIVQELMRVLPERLNAMQMQAVRGEAVSIASMPSERPAQPVTASTTASTPAFDMNISRTPERTLEPVIEGISSRTEPASNGLTKELISKYWDEYKAENLRSGRWTPARNGEPQHQSKFNTFLRVQLNAMHSNHPYTKADARDFKRLLQGLPPRWYHMTDKTIDEIIANTDQEDTISTSTINQNMEILGAFWNWMVNQDYTETNVWQGLRINIPRGTQRKSFDAAEIEKIKQTANSFKGWRQALPLLGLYTGARIAELAQLSIEDIDIDNMTISIDDKYDNQKIKNNSSRRVIPIHSAVQDIIREAKADAEQAVTVGANKLRSLWPDIRSNTLNHKAVPVGLHTNKWLQDAVGETFHCLRHTVVTELYRADQREDIIKDIVGHGQSSVTTRTYRKAGTIDQMRTCIESLPY